MCVFKKKGGGEGKWEEEEGVCPIKVMCERDVLLGDIHWTEQGEATNRCSGGFQEDMGAEI